MIFDSTMRPPPAPWPPEFWAAFREATVRNLRGATPNAARRRLVRRSRVIMHAFTTSFYVASRFLPRRARHDVELIYAAVRYPDEVVDSFDWPTDRKQDHLAAWRADYERALACPTLSDAVAAGIPPWLAGFADVARRAAIPPQHYRDFIAAMEIDLHPPRYETMDDLIARYVHGSAIVVGYFLAHCYGPAAPADLPRALDSARELGIALQLTNFARDVEEDARRGRLYLPRDAVAAAGGDPEHPFHPDSRAALTRAAQRMARDADARYTRAERELDAFAADCRCAIRACIRVYRLLNNRILEPGWTPDQRASVPTMDKLRALPASKYWRLPLARLPGW
jgi:15-cis-phytoene synthase